MSEYLKGKRLVSVFRSHVHEEMYLYVDKKEKLEKVPAALLERFGQPAWTMDLLLSTDKKLARVDSEAVLKAISDNGFFLQMPPPKEEYMDIPNDKISR